MFASYLFMFIFTFIAIPIQITCLCMYAYLRLYEAIYACFFNRFLLLILLVLAVLFFFLFPLRDLCTKFFCVLKRRVINKNIDK